MEMKPCSRRPTTTRPRRAAFMRTAARPAAWVLAVAAGTAGAQTGLAANEALLEPEHYRQNCIACHARMTGGDGAPLYRRKDRLVKDYATLVERVAYCRKSVGAAWSEAQENEVVRYLNRHFYRFEEPGGETPE